jgi:TolA-binding protein
MSFIQRFSRQRIAVTGLAATGMLFAHTGLARDYGTMGIADVLVSAELAMQRGEYMDAIPALQEVISRTAGLTDGEGKKTAQTCRYELARVYYQVGDFESGMPLIEEYLNNEPRPMEKTALRMLAQGCFDSQDWDKIIELGDRLLAYDDLSREDRFSVNLLVGQAYFHKEEWAKCIEPLIYAEDNTGDDRIKGVCQIMVARAYVEAEQWNRLYDWIVRVYRTDRKYDITLNLALMKAGKARYEAGDYLNSLYLYRMVLPREEMRAYANRRVKALEQEITIGLGPLELKERQAEIREIQNSIQILEEMPPYEDEVLFRTGQIYADVKRYWEGYVLFDKLYRADRSSQIGEAALLQSVVVLYEVMEYDRAEKRILSYLDETPDGVYARPLLSMMMRDNLIRQNFGKVIGLRNYVEGLPLSDDEEDRMSQADLHYMLAFGYLQDMEYEDAEEQLGIILDTYIQSAQVPAALYYRGMCRMLQADYGDALSDFAAYQERYVDGDFYADAIFRQGVCQFGLEEISESEQTFTHFIEAYPANAMLSEAYSLRGDIEASKVASSDDPDTLDRALADYRAAIDTATTPLQASYPAFQGAKVYQLEYKWQSIIELMNYYMNRWEDDADIAEAVYWIGQAQIELGQLQEEAIPAYIKAVMRFGNDPERLGVDTIIKELVRISSQYLTPDEKEGLALQIQLKLASVDERKPVLRLRLQVLQALLEGDGAAIELASRLLNTLDDLSITAPGSLALMCDVAIERDDVDRMKQLSDYFMANFEDSEELWHAYRAKATALIAERRGEEALACIDKAQGLFGVEPHMGWAQLMKAETLYAMDMFEEAEEAYYMILGVSQWRGPIFAEATYGMGRCRMGRGDLEGAHTFFQRTYLLYKAYDGGTWAARGYLAAADCLVKLNRSRDAVKTLNDMLANEYTKSNPLAAQAREQLKKIGGVL